MRQHPDHELLPIDHFAVQHRGLDEIETDIATRLIRRGLAVRMCRCGLMLSADIYTQLPALFMRHMVAVEASRG